MARHGFGRGEYRYFTYPLPDAVADCAKLVLSAAGADRQRWNERLRIETCVIPPHTRNSSRDATRRGQTRPTPLLLRYEAGDYNCLHQDLYGEHVFPLQVAVLLSQPGEDFSGGEFVLTEQRRACRSRAEVRAHCRQGDAVIFAVNHRPVQGTRGIYRVNLRHGVSRIRGGERHTLGVIFHDAA